MLRTYTVMVFPPTGSVLALVEATSSTAASDLVLRNIGFNPNCHDEGYVASVCKEGNHMNEWREIAKEWK